jgi:hypothetical protein
MIVGKIGPDTDDIDRDLTAMCAAAWKTRGA